MENLPLLFKRCLDAEKKYIHVEEAGDYCIEREGNRLYLLLQWSHGEEDWKNNFDFPAKPYKDMPITWKAHRGFVRVWKAIEPHVTETIKNPDIKSIITVGYSHGAALAALAQEYIWFNRPDIRKDCYSYAFEAPRVFCGIKIPEELKERWENHYVFRTENDIVTHVPPAIFGFKHVGTLIKMKLPEGEKLAQYSVFDCVNAHYDDNVMKALTYYWKSIEDNQNENKKG